MVLRWSIILLFLPTILAKPTPFNPTSVRLLATDAKWMQDPSYNGGFSYPKLVPSDVTGTPFVGTHADNDNTSGVAASFNGSSLEWSVDSDNARVPGTGQRFDMITAFDIAAPGTCAFHCTGYIHTEPIRPRRPRPPPRRASHQDGPGVEGIYLAFSPSVGGNVIPIANTSSLLPSTHGLAIGALGTPSVDADSNVAFGACAASNAKVSGLYVHRHATPGLIERIADTSTPVPGQPNGTVFHSFFGKSIAGDRMAFTANHKTNVPNHASCGIYYAQRTATGKWVVDRVADKTMDNFVGFGDAVMDEDGSTVAFVAMDNTGAEGVYKLTIGQKAIVKVVAAGDKAPGGGTFEQFPQPPAVHNGELVFRAYTDGGTGIYHVGNTSATPTALVTTDNVLEGGRTIVYLGAAQNSFGRLPSGEAAFSFYASTTNSSGGDAYDGVYLGWV